MSLKTTLTQDMKNAMKAKDALALTTLRMLISEVKKREIDSKDKEELDDSAVLKVVQSLIKQRRDSIAAFEKGGRAELAAKEAEEIKVLEKYLPTQLSEDELRALVKEAIAETGASSPKDMGQVMKMVLAKADNRADGKTVSQMVQAELKPA